MDKIKLLIATDNFMPRQDGIARFLTEFIPRIKEKYEVTVIAPAFPGIIPKIPDVTIIRFPLHKFSVGDFPPARFSTKIKKYVKAADVVFTQTIGPIGLMAIMYAKRCKKPAIAYIHSIEWELVSNSISQFKPFIRLLVRRFARQIYNQSSLLLTSSFEISSILQKNRIFAPKKIVHLGVNTATFVPPKSKANAKINAGLEQKNIVIGFCGRLGREKDLPTLFKAFEMLQKKFSNLTLLIVAGGIGDYRHNFEKNRGIKWVGSVNNVVPYLQAMDIFVLPSLTETSSLATMEAMSSALPVVVTPVGYIKEYVRNGYNGVLFMRGDVNGLARKLEKLARNEALRTKIGKNARQTMKDYSWDKTVADICDAIESFRAKH